ncbi:MAG: hypothetical protein QNK37_05510 [Acidobacteriota bacterium]|nr:hypothetical protein [Acidobacteriota bacterium]
MMLLLFVLGGIFPVDYALCETCPAYFRKAEDGLCTAWPRPLAVWFCHTFPEIAE